MYQFIWKHRRMVGNLQSKDVLFTIGNLSLKYIDTIAKKARFARACAAREWTLPYEATCDPMDQSRIEPIQPKKPPGHPSHSIIR